MRSRALPSVVLFVVTTFLMGGCADLRDELQFAQGQVQELLETKSELEAKISGLEEEKSNLESEVGKLRDSNKALKSKASDHNGQTAKLQELVGKLKHGNAECTARSEGLTKEIGELQKDNQEQANLIEVLEARYGLLERRLNALKLKNADLEKEVRERKERTTPAKSEEDTKPESRPPSKQPVSGAKKPTGQQALIGKKSKSNTARSRVVRPKREKVRITESGFQKRNHAKRDRTNWYELHGAALSSFIWEHYWHGFCSSPPR